MMRAVVYLLKASLDSKSRTVRRDAQLLRAENHEEAVSAQPLKVRMTEGRAPLFRIVIFDLRAAYELAQGQASVT
jgi:hypothetical protein